MNLALVVTTLGRLAPLERLLDSLRGQLVPGDRVVVVTQREVEAVRQLTAQHEASDKLIVITSEPGATRARNAGVAALDGEFLLMFPNDTTWFPDGALARIRDAIADRPVGAMTVTDEHGPKFVLPLAGTALDRWNVWRVIEMGLLIQRSLFMRVGGFDSTIGTGAATPWQAGEVTDLLLRLLRDAPEESATFAWLAPNVAVGGVSDPAGLSAAERRRKLRAYGRGLGRLVARWRYPLWWRLAFLWGGLAFGLRNRATNSLADGWWVFIGRLEGARGRLLGRATDIAAVTR
ncbi:MAG TPA: glycosyltransferase [Candidatus Lumbricidophila sp.]|nr:glycosyltransferase [Candidatus Lumbricidophila sp.]